MNYESIVESGHHSYQNVSLFQKIIMQFGIVSLIIGLFLAPADAISGIFILGHVSFYIVENDGFFGAFPILIVSS